MNSNEVKVRFLGDKGGLEGFELIPKDAIYGRHHPVLVSDPHGDQWPSSLRSSLT